MGEVLAVLSGKGGTGKTSVCAGVATALADEGKRILCVDCDMGLRNLDISLGLAETGALSFLDVCQGGYHLDQAMVHPQFPCLCFLTAPINRGPEDVDPAAFDGFLRHARQIFDYIFLDAPAGVDAGFRLAARHADRILLVTGADPAAIRDAARAGELLELMGKDQIRLIVNRVNRKVAAAMDITMDDIMDRAGLPLLGLVPEDGAVILSAAEGIPLLRFTRRGAATACRRIARRIGGRSVAIGKI